ncbi:uncharacterized protein G2W53_018464 [Senna tora]|uniref:Uncharacterized protein n=1 Tax=Senna tora TaxID=362788 RepID=A0A834WL38_9FABA|nr:uncharacterized protein G2W53_018464 [Senna tora]
MEVFLKGESVHSQQLRLQQNSRHHGSNLTRTISAKFISGFNMSSSHSRLASQGKKKGWSEPGHLHGGLTD